MNMYDEFYKIVRGTLATLAGVSMFYGMIRPDNFVNKRIDDVIELVSPKIKVEDIVGTEQPEKFYEIGGKRVYLEIDGKPVEEIFNRK